MPKEKTTRHFTCAKCSRGQGRLWEKKEPQKVTFQKTIDLDKHLKEEHGSTMFKCTAIGCFRGASAPLFQKSETLTQHIKETHRPDTKYTCPVEDCTFTPSDLDTLAIHAYWTHTRRPNEYDLRSEYAWKDVSVRPAFNAATWQYFRCPVWNCGSLVSGQYDKVFAHLLKHLPVQLAMAQDKLECCGYKLRWGPHPSTEDSAARKITVSIQCPACSVQCDSDGNFRHHLEAYHLLARSPGTSDHFEAWRRNLKTRIAKFSRFYSGQWPCWLESMDKMTYRHFTKEGYPRICSYSGCSFQRTNGKSGSHEHPSLLRDAGDIIEDLIPHRIEILRHYPASISYPYFEEVSPLEQGVMNDSRQNIL